MRPILSLALKITVFLFFISGVLWFLEISNGWIEIILTFEYLIVLFIGGLLGFESHSDGALIGGFDINGGYIFGLLGLGIILFILSFFLSSFWYGLKRIFKRNS